MTPSRYHIGGQLSFTTQVPKFYVTQFFKYFFGVFKNGMFYRGAYEIQWTVFHDVAPFVEMGRWLFARDNTVDRSDYCDFSIGIGCVGR